MPRVLKNPIFLFYKNWEAASAEGLLNMTFNMCTRCQNVPHDVCEGKHSWNVMGAVVDFKSKGSFINWIRIVI